MQPFRYVVEIHQHVQLLGLDRIGDQIEDVIDHARRLEVAGLERELLGLDLGQIQDVVDDLEQMLGRVVESVQLVDLARGERILPHEMRVADDGVHRGADLVAHVRQEGALGAIGALGGDLGRFQFGGAGGDQFLQMSAIGLQLARRLQALAFLPLLFGDVAPDTGDQRLALVHDTPKVDFDVVKAAPLVAMARFEAADVLVQDGGDIGGDLLRIMFGLDVGDRQLCEFFARVAEIARDRIIERHEATSLRVDQHDGVRGLGEHGLDQTFAFGESASVGEIVHDGEELCVGAQGTDARLELARTLGHGQDVLEADQLGAPGGVGEMGVEQRGHLGWQHLARMLADEMLGRHIEPVGRPAKLEDGSVGREQKEQVRNAQLWIHGRTPATSGE